MSVAKMSLDHSLKQLEARYIEKNKIEAQRRSMLQEEENQVRRRILDKSHALKRHAADLRFQISDNLQRSKANRIEKLKPGIDPRFNGFPNIPETPAPIKLQRKIALQASIRQSLEGQIESRRKRKTHSRQQQIRVEKEVIEKVREEEIRRREREQQNRRRMVEELRKAREDAEAKRRWMERIDSEQDYSTVSNVDVLEIHHSGSIHNPSPPSEMDLSFNFFTDPAQPLPLFPPTNLNQSLPSLDTSIPLPRSKSIPKTKGLLPRSESMTQLQSAGLLTLKSYQVPMPVISTVKTVEIHRKEKPDYLMMISQPKVTSLI